VYALGIFYNSCGIISQLLLVRIFWDLGNKVKKPLKPAKAESQD
jgi:hypothetical protein